MKFLRYFFGRAIDMQFILKQFQRVEDDLNMMLDARREQLDQNHVYIAHLEADNDKLADEIEHATRVKEKIKALTA